MRKQSVIADNVSNSQNDIVTSISDLITLCNDEVMWSDIKKKIVKEKIISNVLTVLELLENKDSDAEMGLINCKETLRH